MKRSSLKQDPEIIDSADQVKTVDHPLDSQLPGRLSALQGIFSQNNQADGVGKEQTIHVAPGKINVGQPVAFLI